MQMTSFITESFLLISTLATPFIGAILILVFGKLRYIKESISLISSFALLYLISRIYITFNNESDISLVLHEISPYLHVSFKIEIMGLLFSLIASFLWTITTIYTINYMKNNTYDNKKLRIFYSCFAISIGCTICIAFSGDLLTLFIFYEMLTLSTYPLVTYHADYESQISGRYYIGTLLTTSMLLFLPAIVITSIINNTLDFSVGGIFTNQVSPILFTVIFILYVYGIGKAAVMPIHFWLPRAMVAPTPVSALLHAVAVVKSGVFSILKIIVYILGLENIRTLTNNHFFLQNWLTYVSGFTIIIASLIAIRQQNLKKLLAYSTISQLSYIIMAASLFTDNAIKSAIFQLVTHAFAKITLFFAAGAIYTVTGKKYLNEMKGIGRSMPITMTAFSIGALAMIGIPPTSGFWGKFFIAFSAAEQNNLFVISTLIISTVLNTLYFIPIIYNAFFYSQSEKFKEAASFMLIPIIITASVTVLLFFIPYELYNIMNYIKFQ